MHRAIPTRTHSFSHSERMERSFVSFIRVRRKWYIQRTCFKCLRLILFHLNVFVVCTTFSVCVCCRCSFWILHLRLTFTGALAYPSDHFCSLSLSLSLSTFPILFSSFSHSLARQSKRCLFALHYLYIYISAHKYRL